MMEFRSGLYVIDLGVMLELVSSPKTKNSAFIFELHPKTSSRISSVLSDTLKLILVAHEMLLFFSGNRESGTSGKAIFTDLYSQQWGIYVYIRKVPSIFIKTHLCKFIPY